MNCSAHPGLKYPSSSKASSLIFTVLANSASETGSRSFSGIARAFPEEEEVPAKVICRLEGRGAFSGESTDKSSNRKGERGAFGDSGAEEPGTTKVPVFAKEEGARSASFSFLVFRLFNDPGLLLDEQD